MDFGASPCSIRDTNQMPTDPFQIASKSIFRTMGRDAVYTDKSQNIFTVRIIEKTERKKVFDNFAGTPVIFEKTISMLKPDNVPVQIDEKIEFDSTVYTISNIVEDDGYAAHLEVK